MQVITNVTLRLEAGEEFKPPETILDLSDKTAAELLASGHVRRWSPPPEPKAGEGGKQAAGKTAGAAAKGGAT